MAISKEQPMRPALNDCVDFLNNNLAIGDIESGITNLNARVNRLENTKQLRFISETLEQENMPANHASVEVFLPSGVTKTDIACCFPSGGIYHTDGTVALSAITTIPQCYTRFVGYEYKEETNSVVFYWYPTATTSSTAQVFTYYYTGTVAFYKEI